MSLFNEGKNKIFTIKIRSKVIFQTLEICSKQKDLTLSVIYLRNDFFYIIIFRWLYIIFRFS